MIQEELYLSKTVIITNGVSISMVWQRVWLGIWVKYLESLKNIHPHLCVTPNLDQVIRAYHKEFSLTANYPKGHGELFRDGIVENYPDEFLLHAERATGS